MSKETALIRKILAEHGARNDVRLWRNEVGVFWAGKVKGRTKDGDLVLVGASRISAGLVPGSADLIGFKVMRVSDLTPDGIVAVFVGAEVKTEGVPVEPHQRKWLDMVAKKGGIVGVVESVDDVSALLGAATGGRR